MEKIISCVLFIQDIGFEGTTEKIPCYEGGLESLCLCEVFFFVVSQIRWWTKLLSQLFPALAKVDGM